MISTELVDILRIGYARISTDNPEQLTSLANQETRLLEHGCDRVFSDQASGGSLDRPGWKGLMSYALQVCKTRKVQIVVTSPERISRNQIELLTLIGRLEALGIEIYSLDSGVISTQSPENRLTWGVLSSVYEFQRLNTKQKVIRCKARHRAAGRKLGGINVLGYCWNADKTQRIPDPHTWYIARLIVERYLSGQGLPSLARWLAEEYGIHRTAAGLYGWLRSPVLQGHTKQRYVEGQEVNQIIYNTHEALISPAEAKALELRFEQNRRHSGARNIKACSGIPRCVTCRYCMSLCRDGRAFYYFRCKAGRNRGVGCPHSGGLPYESVEPLVLTKIAEHAQSIASAALKPEKKKPNPEVLQAEAELSQLEALNSDIRHIKNAITELQQRIVYLQSQVEVHQVEQSRLDELAMAMADVEFWQGLNEAERNLIYRDLGCVVWCRGREVMKVELGYYPKRRR